MLTKAKIITDNIFFSGKTSLGISCELMIYMNCKDLFSQKNYSDKKNSKCLIDALRVKKIVVNLWIY